MKTSLLTVKIDEKDKKEAQKLAGQLGLNLSTLVKGLIKDFLRTKKVEFAADDAPLEPTEYLKKAIAEAEEDVKKGRTISFNSWEEEKEFLDSLISDGSPSKKR